MDKPNIIYSLRPQTVLELLDQAFRIYRDNFIAYVGLSALVIVPITIINYFSGLLSSSRLLGLNTSLNSPRANSQFFSQYFNQLGSAIVFLLLIGVVTAFIEVILINGPITFMASERSLG